MEETNPEPATSPENEISRAERRKIKREQAKDERKQEKQKESGKVWKSRVIYGIIGLALVGVIYFLMRSSSASAQDMDSFTNCLKEKGAVIYGNEWCKYTARQKSLFGDSFKNLNYVICDENKALCDQKKITITPTWEVDGKMYKEVQQLETLSQITGCKL